MKNSLSAARIIVSWLAWRSFEPWHVRHCLLLVRKVPHMILCHGKNMNNHSTDNESKPLKSTASFLPIIQIILLLVVAAGLAGTHFKEQRIRAELELGNKSLNDLQSQVTTFISENARRAGQANDFAQTLSKNLGELSESADKSRDQTEAILQIAKKGEQRLENLSAQVAAQPQSSPLRWAYVDDFALRDAAKLAVKIEPLKPEENPETNPELAKKLAEYLSLQTQLQRNFSHFPSSDGFNPSNSKTSDQDDNRAILQSRLAELKVPLNAYFNQSSGRQAAEKIAVDEAIRKACEGKYDLVIDKTFGDNQILYKTSQPVPDITTDVIKLLTSKNSIRNP
jgi:flagellar hook-basal body complex protein FliE